MAKGCYIPLLAMAACWPTCGAQWPSWQTIQKYGPVGLPPSKHKKKKGKSARRRK
jgi:hypothetical protein